MVVTPTAPGAVLYYVGTKLLHRFESEHAVASGVPLNLLFNAYLNRTAWAEDGPVRFVFEGQAVDVAKPVILRWIICRMGQLAGRRERRRLSWYQNTELGWLVPFRKPWTSKRNSCGYWFRRPKTLNEKRLNSLVLAEDGEPAARASRGPMYLPSTWDDIGRLVERSWKSHRLTRWK